MPAGERLEITQRLRLFQHAESVRLTRNAYVLRVRRRELDEYAKLLDAEDRVGRMKRRGSAQD